ncbi:hypothetical protein [Rhizobium terrae]|uniref:hypothetical protein n=1 Tax=Rhizobium terrae TaxID=2171756 RepID=UPI0013C32427|nr:hypothetical protein [Rhizobium terrae]
MADDSSRDVGRRSERLAFFRRRLLTFAHEVLADGKAAQEQIVPPPCLAAIARLRPRLRKST